MSLSLPRLGFLGWNWYSASCSLLKGICLSIDRQTIRTLSLCGPQLPRKLLLSATHGMSVPLIATIFSQAVLLAGIPLLPSHVHRARVCALYRQGAGTCVFGLSHRPCFPQQHQVAQLIRKEFQTRIRPTSYNWWPAFMLDTDSACAFDWRPSNAS